MNKIDNLEKNALFNIAVAIGAGSDELSKMIHEQELEYVINQNGKMKITGIAIVKNKEDNKNEQN